MNYLFLLYIMPFDTSGQRKIANQLYDSVSNKDLKRLAQVGGFVIRRIDLWWDSQTYMREREKWRNIYPDEVGEIDKFILDNSNATWYLSFGNNK